LNYPIFNSDYEYTLEEIVRYVRYFDKHRATIVVPSSFINNPIFHSYHQYREDGLLIRFEWKARHDEFVSRETTVEELFRIHKLKNCNLINYEIINFTENLAYEHNMPNEDVKTIYHSKVMQKKKREKYTKEKYELLELNVKHLCKIPDIFFEFLIDEIQKNIDFENYCNKNN